MHSQHIQLWIVPEEQRERSFRLPWNFNERWKEIKMNQGMDLQGPGYI